MASRKKTLREGFAVAKTGKKNSRGKKNPLFDFWSFHLVPTGNQGFLLVCVLSFMFAALETVGGAYYDKCFCPGKDLYLARDANLRTKMYHLKSEYFAKNLSVAYRPGKTRFLLWCVGEYNLV